MSVGLTTSVDPLAKVRLEDLEKQLGLLQSLPVLPISRLQCLWKPDLTPALGWQAMLMTRPASLVHTPDKLLTSYPSASLPGVLPSVSASPEQLLLYPLLVNNFHSGAGNLPRGLATKTSSGCFHGALGQSSWLSVLSSSSIFQGPSSSPVTHPPCLLIYSDSSPSPCPTSYLTHFLKAVFMWLHTSHRWFRGY